MNRENSLKNQLLIAMPGLGDSRFKHTVTLICEHNDDGAMGIVINRPTPITLTDLLPQMGIHVEAKTKMLPILEGGPVEPEHGFVLHTPCGKWRSSLKVNENLTLTTSRDILEKLHDKDGPELFLIALGYAGWGAGQLEREMVENSWLTAPVTSEILFKTDYAARWHHAADTIGIKIEQLSLQPGHA